MNPVNKGTMAPVQLLNKCGLFDSPTTAAHCVYIENEDYDILSSKNVTVATCPKSNLKLSSGVCNASEIYKHNINLAVATDGVASNNNLDILEEMRFFSLLQKGIYLDSTAISPSQAVYAISKAGAIAQGRSDCGAIKVGNKADLVVIDLDKPYMYPSHNILNNIVYSACGTDIVMTMCDGKILYKNGEYLTIDIEKVKYELSKRALEISKSL